MRALAQSIMEVASFFWLVPGYFVKTQHDEYLRKIGRYYSWSAGLFGAAGNCLAALIIFPLYQSGVAGEFRAALLLTAFYLVRGMKLIDGYIDLSEGISLSLVHGQGTEEVWRAIKNPCCGSFGIIWGVIIIVWQFIVLKVLVSYGFSTFIGLWGVAGLLSCISLSVFHVGRNHYHSDSRFRNFGEKIGGIRSALVASVLSTALAWVFLSFLHISKAMRLQILVAAVLLAMLIGIALRLFVLKTLQAFNGDVIGFVVLISEVSFLFVVTQSGLF